MNEVGDGIKAESARWSFGGCTPTKFDEHVARSIPGYNEGHSLCLQISDFFARRQSRCYDLGTSIGTLAHALALRHKDVRVIGLDTEAAMITEARADQ